MNLNNHLINQNKEKRNQLVNNLRKRGIDDEQVLFAINSLPREIFVHPSLINQVYEDNALPIECEQTISQPYTVAFMTEQLEVEKGDKILEIGTGSGYQACILCLLGAKVWTIERLFPLFENTKSIFKTLDFNVNIMCGDGTIGWRQYAPYNGIIVTAASPKVPKPLLEQLAIGGKLIIPIGDLESQSMTIIKRNDEDNYETEVIDKFRFVPLIGKEGWREEQTKK